jgi:hypothetical protein
MIISLVVKSGFVTLLSLTIKDVCNHEEITIDTPPLDLSYAVLFWPSEIQLDIQ